jgi:hypothetical protein
MTEAEWLDCTEVKEMIRCLRERGSDRKFRLFAIACCRRIWKYISDNRSRAAVEFAESYVDEGLARRKGRPAIFRAAKDVCRETERDVGRTRDSLGYAASLLPMNAANAALALVQQKAWWAAEFAAGFAAQTTAWAWLIANRPTSLPGFDPAAMLPEKTQQSKLLRDIFGNPFRPISVHPACLAWNNGTVSKIAQAIYEERTFDRLPVLADALEDAGCDNADLLAHCRSGGEHVRGCWVVDQLLGKN